MIVFAIEAFELMGTWFAFFCLKSGGVGLLIGFTAPGHVSVMFEFVGAFTLLTF